LGKETWFEAWCTYLDKSPLHEEATCGMVDMVQELKQIINVYSKEEKDY
jgi:hypothetical protein